MCTSSCRDIPRGLQFHMFIMSDNHALLSLGRTSLIGATVPPREDDPSAAGAALLVEQVTGMELLSAWSVDATSAAAI